VEDDSYAVLGVFQVRGHVFEGPLTASPFYFFPMQAGVVCVGHS
jgi:hypothetical protein